MRRWLREPLLHFLALGAVLFGLHAWLRPTAAPRHRIEISRAEIAQLTETFSRQWLRAPTAAELDGLVDGAVKEEIFAREAVELGLDRGDVVVRRRLAQKYEFVGRDLLEPAAPSESELGAYVAAHADRYRRPERLTLEQIYFGSERRAAPEADAKAALTSLERGAPAGAIAGDAILVARHLIDRSSPEIAAELGPEFAAALARLEGGGWRGPLRSTYGWHLVRIAGRSPGGLPALAEVRSDVERDWRAERRRELETELYSRLRARYQVVVVEPGGADSSAQLASVSEARP